MPKSEWFASWFDTGYYHQLYNNRDEAEAALFIQNLCNYLKLEPNVQVLDLACGKGRHAKMLHQLGYQVLGVDLSANSICIANEQASPGLEFQVHDMRNEIEGRHEYFDAIFNLFTSFGYFDDLQDNRRVMNAVYSMLKPGGMLVIDFMNAVKVRKNLVPSEQVLRGEVVYSIQRRANETHIFKEIHVKDGEYEQTFTERVQALDFHDFQELLTQTGFVVEHVFGDFNLNTFSPDQSERLIIIARK